MKLTIAKSPTVLPSDGLVPLESVLCTEELSRRPPRPPDYETENRALTALAQALADSPQTILQTMAEKMLEVFQCDSAGFSLLTKDEKRFYWAAIAGAWQPHLGGGTPRDFGPCGDVLDCNIPLLFSHWERRYPYLLAATPAAEEGLLVPFYVQGKAVGTIWAIAHDDRRKFDAEDLRQLESLGRFASAAYQAVESLSDREQRRAALNLMEEAVQSRQAVEKLNAVESLGAREQHRAALNLMEDAVQSRQAVEKLNMELRESERRFARFMQHLPGLAWIKDPDGRYVYANDAAEKAFRTPRAELYGKTDKEVFSPETAAQFTENDQRALASDSGIQAIETLEHADGIHHHSIVSKFPIPGPDGQAVLIGGVAIDITERMRAEEALQESDRRKNEFLAMLAHELRNPLAPIRNALQIVRLTKGNGEAVQSASEMMERQIGQMVRLVDDLLDVSRISRGKIELRRERIELASAVNHAVEAIRPLCKSTDHELTVTLVPEPVYLNADPTRLVQVVGNLLNNACKFTERGGRIRLTVERESGQAVIRVQDSGIGIAANQLPRIFEMFTQVDSSLERTQGGLGIGLMLVKNLVEMHGGTVEVHSAGIGQGSEFVVRLPILVETAKVRPEPTVSEPTPTTARRILVVDDNRDSAESLAMLLELTGNETHTAHDGLEAVEAAATFKPEVVLLDIGLPKMNGFEAARKIREQPWGKKVVLVALTGWGQEEDRQKSREAGFDGHLVKPVDHAALTKLLAELGAG